MSNRVLHIGSHRTGTSSLQKFLQENKEELKLMASMIRKDKEGGRTIVIYKSSIIHRMTIPLKLYSDDSKKVLD